MIEPVTPGPVAYRAPWDMTDRDIHLFDEVFEDVAVLFGHGQPGPDRGQSCQPVFAINLVGPAGCVKTPHTERTEGLESENIPMSNSSRSLAWAACHRPRKSLGNVLSFGSKYRMFQPQRCSGTKQTTHDFVVRDFGI